MKKTLLIVLLIIIQFVAFSKADSKIKKNIKVEAIRINEPVKIDGVLSEGFWNTTHGIADFTQRDPNEGTEPSEKTTVYIAYDDEYVYIGARMYDSSPDSIYANLARRDADSNSDQITVFLDPYNDKRTGYYFGITAAGTLKDGVLYNDEWDDNTWDGVWEGKTKIENDGWTAEFRIPFSQLKFKSSDAHVWGINFKRDIARKHERDYIVYTPRNESGFVSRFIELNGINNVQPSNKLEILPYITSKAAYTSHNTGDPFNDGSQYSTGFGADLKYGLGSNLTLNLAINPDFGQVEIDPAVINLSDVETFFSEKRPFFVEGSNNFSFGNGGSRSNWSFNWGNPSFFYSRRIGGSPHGSLPGSTNYVDYPSGTHILGSAKITGKIAGDINIGVIQAVTQREFADIESGGKISDIEVEPLSYYGIFRAQKDIDGGRQGIGFISTVTQRFFNDSRLSYELNQKAYTGGIDGWTFLDEDKTYVLTMWGGYTYVAGNQSKMLSLQQNSSHYFQRPDAKFTSLDSTAASLTGYAGRLMLNKQNGNVFLNTALGVISPGFDNNDLGFTWRTNIINWHLASGYNWREPTDWYRDVQLGGALFRSYNYDGDITWTGVFAFGNMTLPNYYSLHFDAAYNPETVSDRGTRGGPKMLNPGGYQAGFYASSDSRKNLVFDASYYSYNQTDNSRNWSVDLGINFRPASNIVLSISPGFSKNFDNSQYIGTFSDPYAVNTYKNRYVFGELEQTTFSAGIRLNWTFTPELSLQLYAQPLISTGKYSSYKELAQPGTYDFNVYGQGNSTFDKNNYIVDPDGAGPAQPIELGNNDFNFSSLRGNAVLRWEYNPGSVVYFVWTQTRSDFTDNPDFKFGKSISNLLDLHPDNIFLVKFTYWLNM